MMSGCVTVMGPPLMICSLKRGITLPLLPSTLPNRVVTNCVQGRSPFAWGRVCGAVEMALLSDWQYISHMRLEHPMTFVGLTALSVDIMTNFFLPYLTARSAMMRVA